MVLISGPLISGSSPAHAYCLLSGCFLTLIPSLKCFPSRKMKEEVTVVLMSIPRRWWQRVVKTYKNLVVGPEGSLLAVYLYGAFLNSTPIQASVSRVP